MKGKEFDRILDEGLSRIQNGEDLQNVLADYPHAAERLKPLLITALMGGKLPHYRPSESAREKAEIRLFQEVTSLKEEGVLPPSGTNWSLSRYPERWWNGITQFIRRKENLDMKLAPRLAAYLLIIVLAAGFFTVSASASSLPGDPLYGLKRGWEQARMTFAFSEQAREELKSELEQQRREELTSLLLAGRYEEVEYYGVIEEMEASQWVIGGYTVLIDSDTELSGALEIGTRVKVEALTQDDGSLLAIEISAEGADESDDVMENGMDDGMDDDMDDEADDDMDDEAEDDMDDEDDDDMDDDADDDMDDDADDDMDDDADDDMDDDADDDMDDEDDDDMGDDTDDDMDDDTDDDMDDDADEDDADDDDAEDDDSDDDDSDDDSDDD